MTLLHGLLRAVLALPGGRSALARLHAAAQQAARAPAEGPASAAALDGVADVPEITPLPPRHGLGGLPGARSRLNLLLPALSPQHVFGGVATALRCLAVLQAGFPAVRIVVTDEVNPQPAADTDFGRWPLRALDDDDLGVDADVPGHGSGTTLGARHAERTIVAAGHRVGRTLAVREGDRFIVTAWWTAHLGLALLHWQDATFGPADPPRRLLYLIQDFEPGFYPWSDRWALAEATYRHPERTLALFNTALLAAHFQREGYRFGVTQVLEPRLNPALAALRAGLPVFDKRRTVLVYGRPGTPRNAFGVLLAGLRRWAAIDPCAHRWQVLAVGEPFPPLLLGPSGLVLRSLGKLPLADYAQQLAQAAIGVSLMVSPHPSYPPLEMAAFGARVIVNRHAGKNLAEIADRFLSLDRLDPDTLAAALQAECAAFEHRLAGAAQLAVPRDALAWPGAFLDGGAELGDTRVLIRALGGNPS